MVDSSEKLAFLDHLHTIFSSLQSEEVEQFYTAYRQWLLQQRIAELRQRLAALQEQISQNELRMQQHQPSPLALASLARLQAYGVSDTELLDQMLERGEAWLDATMQRLDYFEQFENFLSDDYTQWCRRALEGAFDWIDTLLMADTASPAPSPTPVKAEEETASGAEDRGTIEAMLLRKLSSEADDDQFVAEEKEATLKQPAVTTQVADEEPAPGESQSEGEELNAPQEQLVNGANAEIVLDTAQEQPALADLAAEKAVAANGTAQPANGVAEDSSPLIARAPARKKRGIVGKLAGKLLGS